MTLLIETPYGDRYRIADNGDITRLDMPGFTASGQWKFVGLVPVNSNRIAVRLADIDAAWLAGNPLLYKNRHPRYTVMDLDHGTNRVWGNTVYHGVKSIRIEP